MLFSKKFCYRYSTFFQGLIQGWATCLVGGPDLKKKTSFTGHSIFENFYLTIKKDLKKQMCSKIKGTVYLKAKKSIFVNFYYKKNYSCFSLFLA